MIAAGLLALLLIPLTFGRPSGQPTQDAVQRRIIHPAFPSGFFPMTFAVKPSNITGLHASLLDVSDPTSPNYRNHLSQDQVQQFLAPTPESLNAVKDWLAKYNISPDVVSASGDILRAQVSVDVANKLLNANYTPFVHEPTNITALTTGSYSIPSDVQPHLDFVYPTTKFIPPPVRGSAIRVVTPLGRASKKTRSRRAAVSAQCVQTITPTCLQAIYNIPSTPATAAGNSLAVSGFLDEIPDQGDLTQFLSVLRTDIQNGTFTVQSLDGGVDNANGQGTTEASLDIQYTVGLATNVPTTFLSVGPNNQDGLNGFLDLVNTLLQQDALPPVLTTSFGADEPDFTPDIAQTLCNAYAQLGARGTSVLFSSGDGGVGGSRSTDVCPNGFVPTFPSGCPFLTSVGSTQDINPEVAAPFSAGGFSNIFARPDYQTTAVDAYLEALGNTNAGLFNASGRAYPDVSTQGNNFLVDIGGEGQLVLGTSASSPTFASMIALINDQLLNAGQKPLGFLNPLLYSQGVAAFNDITSGSNPSCGTQGFPALPGWDAVTGLGTPDFSKLLTVALGSSASSGTAGGQT